MGMSFFTNGRKGTTSGPLRTRHRVGYILQANTFDPTHLNNTMNTRNIKSRPSIKRVLLASIVAMTIGHLQALAEEAQAPKPTIDFERTALVVTDPQNDFLSPEGATWGLVGKSVTANKTVEHIEALFKAAKATNIPVFVSPHYYYPTDKGWMFGGTIENVMHKIHMFDRAGPLNLEGFEGSGADWLELYKPLINDGKTIVTNPHKVYGPETNDLVLQLRKRGIDKVILAGMSANLCTEAHMRELIEQGFEVTVVSDGTAAAQVPNLDGYKAAMTNFRFIASAVRTTAQITKAIAKARR
jgi:nicotinamidase-related amidase